MDPTRINRLDILCATHARVLTELDDGEADLRRVMSSRLPVIQELLAERDVYALMCCLEKRMMESDSRCVTYLVCAEILGVTDKTFQPRVGAGCCFEI
jgi:hypothetical protein